MDNGDGIAVGWLGHPIFRDKEGRELCMFILTPPTTAKWYCDKKNLDLLDHINSCM